MTWDDRTFDRLCAQLERELHRSLTPSEVTALRLAQPVTPPPETVERRKRDLDPKVVPDRRASSE